VANRSQGQPELELVERYDFESRPAWTAIYRRAHPTARSGLTLSDTKAGPEIERLTLPIVDVEGPVSYEIVAQRLKTAFGAKYLSAPAKQRITNYLNQMVRRGDLQEVEQGFLMLPDATRLMVRVPDPDDSDSRRSPDQVPWLELELAIAQLVDDSRAINHDDLIVAAARVFGWSRTSDVRLAVSEAIHNLTAKAVLDDKNGMLSLRQGGRPESH
jgi:hypothetical protein